MAAVTRKRSSARPEGAKKTAPAKKAQPKPVEDDDPTVEATVDSKEAVFSVEKETPGTMRFKEEYDSDAGELPLCGTIYIKKTAWRELGEPTKLYVTVQAG